MAKVRVSTLAKEFGMTSKELMGHLAEMKIPAKSASSALEDAYVAMVRKQLASVIEARAKEVEAAKQAEEEAAAAEEAARAAEAERERIAAEKAREEERRQFAAAQAAEEAARAEAEAKKKAEQERLAREKEEAAREAQRRAVPASDSGSRFRSLLDQIAAQETVLKEKKDAEAKAKAERAAERGNRRGGNNDRRGGRRNDRNASDNNSDRNSSESRPHSHRTNASNNVAAGMDFPNPDKQGKGKKRKGGHGNDEDHYSRMAREAEEYSREKVLEEARAAVEEASRESTGRRKKRKERREQAAEEARHQEAIEAAVDFSTRYLTDRFLPDKAIDLLDEGAAHVWLGGSEPPEDTERRQRLEQQLEQAVSDAQYEKAAALRDELRTLVRGQLAARRAQHTVSLTKQDIAAIVAERTGIPVGRLRQSDRERLLSLRETLSARVIGQQAAVDAVCTAVLRGRTGLADAARPAASFLLIGPTGVGKTELCKQLAQVVYGSPDALIRVDMSEYMEPSSVSRLLGAPPGYVGYDAGGTLTEKIRRRPYCVLLFDELEKAHRDVTGILLQLLGDGILTDSLGRTVSFKNAIVVMTSNLTGTQTGKPGLGFTPDCEDVRAQTVLREAFSPEFLGRIDCVTTFRPLTAADLGAIARLQLRQLAERLQKQNVTLTAAPDLPERLGALCAHDPGGARSLRRRLQTLVEGPAAELLLRDPSVRALRVRWEQGTAVVEAGSA